MYGDWAQYQRRRVKALREDNPATIGVQCRECVGKAAACHNCLLRFDDWAVPHFGEPALGMPLDAAAARRVAAR